MGCNFFVRHFFLWRVPDYLMIIVIAIIAAVIGAKVRPHCRDFEWSDPSINHPFTTKETFPMYAVIIAVIFIAVIYFIGELCTKWKRPAGKLNMCLHINGWIVTQAYSIILAFVFVNVSKLYAGRLRPDFIARLAREGITEANVGTLTHKQLCHAARNGRLSFPSGHSGTSFAGYVPPCLYLMGLLRTLNGGRVWLATLAMLPMILPVAVAVSRTVDYRHNFDDILCGSLCGALCGVFAVLISFRVSQRGEWTLRDHPDDTRETRAWLRDLLGHPGSHDENLRRINAGRDSSEDDDGTSSESGSSSSDGRSRSREGPREGEAAVRSAHPRRTSASSPDGQKSRRHRHEQKYRAEPVGDAAAGKKGPTGSVKSSPLSAASLPQEADYISPAVYQERAANPSPSTRKHAAPAVGSSAASRTASDRRRQSNGDPATVERFYPQE